MKDPCKAPFFARTQYMDQFEIFYIPFDDPDIVVDIHKGEHMITNHFNEIFGEAPFQFCSIEQENQFNYRTTGYSVVIRGRAVFTKFFCVN